MKTIKNSALGLIAVLVLCCSASSQNLKADEIVAKHLDAIGKREKRDEIKTLMARGASEYESRIPVIKGGGKAVVVSDPDNLFFVISLNSKEYPFEKIGFFNGQPSLPFINAGNRSLLGTFVAEHEKMLSEGLFGGAMSLRWSLLNLDKKRPKIKTAGSKKVEGRKAYVLEYSPSSGGSSEFSIRLYFDAESFNHIRSEYRREVTRGQGTFGQANQQANAVLLLVEDFSDFRNIDGLTLPHAYKVDFLSNSNTSSNQYIWGIKVSDYYFNQKLAPDFFTFNPK